MNSTPILPIDVIGLLVTVNVLLVTPTLSTVPDPAVLVTVIFPLLEFSDILSPAVNLVTPVLVTIILPAVVIGPPDTETPVPAVKLTLVTVPETILFDAEVILP